MRSESGIWCVVGVSLVGDRRRSLVEAMPYFVRKNLIKTKGRRGVGASKKIEGKSNCHRKTLEVVSNEKKRLSKKISKG